VSAGRFSYLSTARYTIDGAVGTLFLRRRLGGVNGNFEEFLELVDFVIQIKVIIVLQQVHKIDLNHTFAIMHNDFQSKKLSAGVNNQKTYF
jgi:hypothetical protein